MNKENESINVESGNYLNDSEIDGLIVKQVLVEGDQVTETVYELRDWFTAEEIRDFLRNKEDSPT